MKNHLFFALALLGSGLSQAQDIGQVLSATPVVQQVGVPRQVCSSEQVELQRPNSGAGAALGALAGGAIGNAATHGPNQAAATVLGMVGGAVLGDRVEGKPEPQLHTVQRCSVQTVYENRTIGYDVVYTFAGKQYRTRMPRDPGPTIALQVMPAGAEVQALAPTDAVPVQAYDAAVAPVVVQAAPVVVQTVPVYGYYPRPYYPPVSLNLGFGYWGGHHGGWRH